jgi:hypothetical protein
MGGGGGGSTAFQGDGAVLVAGDEGDEVLQHDRTTENEGRSTEEGDNGRGWELTEWGNRRRRWLHFRRRRHASGGRLWIGGKGGEVALTPCLQRRKRGGERKGGATSVVPL